MTRTAPQPPAARLPKAAPSATAADPSPARTPLEELDTLLRQMIAEHETLLTLATEHRRAIAQADMSGLASAVHKQQEGVQRIAALERRRATLIPILCPPADAARPTAHGHAVTAAAPRQPPGPAQTTITGIATAAPEPARTRLLSLGQTLRDLINKLHNEHRVIREAASSLSSHMEGLMRQVYRKLSHAGTYARGGSVSADVQVVSALDLRS